MGGENAIFIHLTLVPYIATAGELKTKPTQHSVRELRAIGIQPDILLCRCDRPLPAEIKRKIGLFCNIGEDAVISAVDVDSIYEVPLHFSSEGIDEIIMKLLDLPYRKKDLSRVGRSWSTRSAAAGRGDDRHRRQVRLLRGLLQVAQRGADPRRHGLQRQRRG